MSLPLVFFLTALPTILTAALAALVVWGSVKMSRRLFRKSAHPQ